jgi:hypothetical protein
MGEFVENVDLAGCDPKAKILKHINETFCSIQQGIH